MALQSTTMWCCSSIVVVEAKTAHGAEQCGVAVMCLDYDIKKNYVGSWLCPN